MDQIFSKIVQFEFGLFIPERFCDLKNIWNSPIHWEAVSLYFF